MVVGLSRIAPTATVGEIDGNKAKNAGPRVTVLVKSFSMN
jgi:hypothetical protein